MDEVINLGDEFDFTSSTSGSYKWIVNFSIIDQIGKSFKLQ